MEHKWKPEQRWTEDDVERQSHSRRDRVDRLVLQAFNYLKDPQKKDRLKALQCLACFYAGPSIAGQAITNWNCRACLKDQPIWPHTNTPTVCTSCAETHRLCVCCGSDLHLLSGRSRVKKLKDKS